MAKTTGLGGAIIVADAGSTARTISNDVSDWMLSTPRGVQDVTGVDKSAKEILLLLADLSATLKGTFNSATNQSHDVFKTVPSTSVARATTFNPLGTNTGLPTLVNNLLYTDYQLARTNTGELTWSAPGQLADGTVPTWTVQ